MSYFHEQGAIAAQNGQGTSLNPYKAGPEQLSWLIGWYKETDRIRNEKLNIQAEDEEGILYGS